MIDGLMVKKLRQIHDERGYLMEMLRSDWPEFERFGQCYLTVAYPGVVKAWHYHKVQTDHFVVLKGTAKVVCYDNREGSKSKGEVNEFFPGEHNPMLIKIPPLVLHGFKSVGGEAAYLVNLPTELYHYDEPDEYRLPYDSPEVPYDWAVRMR
ncbi:MAG: dTDP-4-dehydrorhamnose 3,5-epimerase family protein [Candidatus Geothermarchaeales archaeon]